MKALQYFTWAHNIEGCLRNASYVVQRTKKRFVQYINGDYMGDVPGPIEGMAPVDKETVKRFLPKGFK